MATLLWVLGKLGALLAWGSLIAGANGFLHEYFVAPDEATSIANAAMFFVGIVGVIARRSWMQWRKRCVLKAIELPPHQFHHEFRPPPI